MNVDAERALETLVFEIGGKAEVGSVANKARWLEAKAKALESLGRLQIARISATERLAREALVSA